MSRLTGSLILLFIVSITVFSAYSQQEVIPPVTHPDVSGSGWTDLIEPDLSKG